MNKNSSLKPEINDALLDQCYAQMFPHMERKLRRALTQEEAQILRRGIESATQQVWEQYDYLVPQKTVGKMRSDVQLLRKRLQEIASVLSSLTTDTRFREALQQGVYAPEVIQKHAHHLDWLCALTATLKDADIVFSHIDFSHLPEGGATTHYRLIPMVSLVEVWKKITGKFPGTSRVTGTNEKKGPFVDFATDFFAVVLPAKPISGQTISDTIRKIKKDAYLM
jgi:hypothetical protein